MAFSQFVRSAAQDTGEPCIGNQGTAQTGPGVAGTVSKPGETAQRAANPSP